MNRLTLFSSVTAMATCALAMLPAAVGAETISGKVTEPNFVTHKFWLQVGRRHIAVMARGASFRYHGRDANIYRLMGTPRVQVSGDLSGNNLTADSVEVLTGPTVRLQRSEYTDRAIPRFTRRELAPRR